ncbi:MAG: hypothetical protein AAGU74_12730 [Bacillota bacterium]
MEWIGAVIGAIAAISGMALGWTARAKQSKREAKQDGCEDGALKTDVAYIKRGVDDIRLDMKAQGQRMDALAERVTRVEESTKQAHKRIDRIDQREE